MMFTWSTETNVLTDNLIKIGNIAIGSLSNSNCNQDVRILANQYLKLLLEISIVELEKFDTEDNEDG